MAEIVYISSALKRGSLQIIYTKKRSWLKRVTIWALAQLQTFYLSFTYFSIKYSVKYLQDFFIGILFFLGYELKHVQWTVSFWIL